MADEFVDLSPDELFELFNNAAAYLRHNAGSQSKENLLHLYARYKQATEGPCCTKKPGMLDFQGKHKWEAWKKLDDMSKERAMVEYITHLSLVCPGWEAEIENIEDKKPTGGSSWVSVSTMTNTDPEIDSNNKTIFDWCKEGDVNQVSKLLENPNIDVNDLDESGMALLHWACDRGLKDMVDCLLRHNADIDIKDEDKQSPLHYAVSCEHEDVVSLLLSKGADKHCTDCDGSSPVDLETTDSIRTLLSENT